MERGKFIVIEGSDGTGKETQSKKLKDNINNSGILGSRKIHLVSFPDYESPAGKKIRAYLDGEMGDVEEAPPRKVALLYAEDRRAKKEEMETVLAEGDWLIADRYVQSNMAYQGAKISNNRARESFYSWIHKLEYDVFGIPKPDLVIMLQLDEVIAARHLAQREQFDIHERNASYLDRVKIEYERLAGGYYKDIFSENWHIVPCSINGKQFSREEISERIGEIVSQNL